MELNSPIKVPVSLSRYSILPTIFYFFNTIPIAGGVRCTETFASIMILHISNFITFVKMKQFVLFSWNPGFLIVYIRVFQYCITSLYYWPVFPYILLHLRLWNSDGPQIYLHDWSDKRTSPCLRSGVSCRINIGHQPHIQFDKIFLMSHSTLWPSFHWVFSRQSFLRNFGTSSLDLIRNSLHGPQYLQRMLIKLTISLPSSLWYEILTDWEKRFC